MNRRMYSVRPHYTKMRVVVNGNIKFSGAFAKLRKATVCEFVRPFVHVHQFGFHLADFHEILYLRIFRKSLETIQVLLKSDKDNGYFKWRPVAVNLWYFVAELLLKWEMFWAKVVDKIKTHILCSVTFFPKIVPFMRERGKIWWGQRGHRCYGVCALHVG